MKRKTIAPYRDSKAAAAAEAKAALSLMEKIPTRALLDTIEYILKIIDKRGTPVRDFDHKEKTVQQVRMIGGQPYFLCALPEEDYQEYKTELQRFKEDKRILSREIIKARKENKRLREELAIMRKKAEAE